jgi:hypothetical protein
MIHQTDSVTSSGLWELVQRDEKGEKRFIVIPDINPTFSRRPATAQATIGNLLSLTGDGTLRIDDGRNEKLCRHEVMGLVTACTPEIYQKHAKQWFALGLTRRIIPLHYGYTTATRTRLQNLVREGKIHSTFLTPYEIKTPIASRPLISETLGFTLETWSASFATNLGKLKVPGNLKVNWYVRDILPISPHVTLRTLAMAHALRRKSTRVEQQDIDFISQFLNFTNPEQPGQL